MLPPKRIRRPLSGMENFLCSIVGTCLTLKETEKIARRFKYSGDTSPYPLHVWMIEACRKAPEVAKYLQKYLCNKYRLTIKRLDEFAGQDLLEVWQEAVGEGRVAGAYFGILTRMDAPVEVISQVFGEVHMMSHLKGAETRAELKELEALRLHQQVLQNRLDKLLPQLAKAKKNQELLRQGLREKKGEISQLRNKLLKAERDLLRSLTDMGDLERLKGENRDLRRQLAAERQRREELDLVMLKAAVRETPKTGRRPEEAEIEAWQPDSTPADCPLEQGGECPLLCNKFILFVGGLDRLEPHYRSLVEADFAGRFMRHDGDCRNGRDRLIHMVNRAEAVICPLNCVSHQAYLCVKKLCKDLNKPCVLLRNSGLGSLRRALMKLAGSEDGGEKGPAAIDCR
jgi:hypothetical protein